MAIKASKNKNANIVISIALISVVVIAFVLTSGFSQANFRINTETSVNQGLKQSPFPASEIRINETNDLNVVNSSSYSSAPLNTDPVSIDTLDSTTYNPPDMSGFFFLPSDNTGQDQVAVSDSNNNYNGSSAAAPISLDASKFVTYTYGGYSVQQQDSSHFNFSFPDNTDQGQLSGSDAIAGNFYVIQKLDFDAAFIAPKTNALGFDEMAIFASSNTSAYKGTEFGIRMDLKEGFIYGYIQEPNVNSGDVDFNMIELMPNDGIMHHYTITMLGSEVSFHIDGIDYGYLSFPSNTDYSSLSFSICAVVHRFTDGWDSSGDIMLAGNFSLNQQ